MHPSDLDAILSSLTADEVDEVTYQLLAVTHEEEAGDCDYTNI